MEIKHLHPNVIDNRGAIADLVTHENLTAVTFVTTKAGCERGGHFHKDTVEWIFLLEGKFNVSIQSSGSSGCFFEMDAGELLRLDPGDLHTFFAITDCRMIEMSRTDPAIGEKWAADTFQVRMPEVRT